MKGYAKNYFRQNLLTIVVLIGMIMLYLSIPSQIAENMMAKSAISPRFFPTFSIVCVMICCALLLLIDGGQRVLTHRRGQAFPTPAPKDDNVSYLRVVLVAVLLIIWYLALGIIGFIISTVVLMLLMTYILGCRNKIVLIAFPVVFTLAIYFVFVILLHVNLPEVLF